jgi:uncharacterized protein YggU (UPF0235/DUF167 family)
LNTCSISPSPFAAATGGVRVRIRVTPRASANRLAGLVAEVDGGVALKVLVTAVAEGGRANEAVLALLARQWRLPKRDLTLVVGAADRRKTILVAGNPAQLLPLLEAGITAAAGGSAR